MQYENKVKMKYNSLFLFFLDESQSLNLFFMEMYGDQSAEFVRVY